MALTVRKMEKTDLLAIQALFARVGSTTQVDQNSRFLVVESENGAIVGTVGLDKAGELGLLRTMVIDSNRTHPAASIEFIQLAIAFAQTEGIHTVYALSNGKVALFEPLGFERIEEPFLPEVIKTMDHYQLVTETDQATIWAYSCSPI
ncbi:GNAT family N-acetyltransferase [Shouchella patagoniensis]|uniref:GNAT family N-acetyltransferase n=1 Tax=Shouchella patagoniensis TaxID=228576 RepID=UPI00099589BA|nr:hypothetical protein [Shouchella patagoniensis]